MLVVHTTKGKSGKHFFLQYIQIHDISLMCVVGHHPVKAVRLMLLRLWVPGRFNLVKLVEGQSPGNRWPRDS